VIDISEGARKTRAIVHSAVPYLKYPQENNSLQVNSND